ncbi:MAG TPA: DUF1254 domain-containing protein [Rhabdaerophilum sp.]|nr:DUF1254 domain-containing protein [Rhabdaerophilum sp.]
MRFVVHAILFTIVAGLTHIASIFLIPYLTHRDIYSRLEAGAPVNQLAAIDNDDLKSFPFADTNLAVAVCRYDLATGPLRLRVPLSETFLVLALAERRSGIYSSVSDRAATGGMLDVVVATAPQLDRIARLDDEDQAVEEIRVAAPSLKGLAILKVFIDRPSSREKAEALLRRAQCESEALPN